MSKPIKQIHLAAHFPGVNNTTVWSDPASGSHIEFDSFVHFAKTAERGKFDFMFLAEGLRLREQNGEIYDLDVVGRPDTFTILAALAAVTDRLGLTGTINSTFNEPYEVARQFASLDHLSEGRAAWNVVTSWDAFTGQNFRRGGFLAEDQRYARAESFLAATHTLFDSWRGDEIVAAKESGTFLADPDAGESSSKRATPTTAASSPLPRRMPSSPGTARWRMARSSSATSRAGWPSTGGATRTCSSCRPRRSCSATPMPRPPTSRTTCAWRRCLRRPRSSSSNSCGTATSPTTTPTARCPPLIPSSARTPSPGAAPASGCTATRSPRPT